MGDLTEIEHHLAAVGEWLDSIRAEVRALGWERRAAGKRVESGRAPLGWWRA